MWYLLVQTPDRRHIHYTKIVCVVDICYTCTHSIQQLHKKVKDIYILNFFVWCIQTENVSERHTATSQPEMERFYLGTDRLYMLQSQVQMKGGGGVALTVKEQRLDRGHLAHATVLPAHWQGQPGRVLAAYSGSWGYMYFMGQIKCCSSDLNRPYTYM